MATNFSRVLKSEFYLSRETLWGKNVFQNVNFLYRFRTLSENSGFSVIKVSAVLSKLHCLCPEVKIEEKHLVWKLSTVLLHLQFEQKFCVIWKTFVSDIFLKGCQFWILPVQEKSICGKNNFLKDFQCFIIFGFWAETIYFFPEKLLQICQNCILRVQPKNLIKNVKLDTILGFSVFQQEILWHIRRRRFWSSVKNAFFLIRGNFCGKKSSEELILFSHNLLALSLKLSDC